MNTTTKTPARIAFEAKIASQSTATLLAVHAMLDAKGFAVTPEEFLSRSAVADAITDRHNLDDALDALFEDDSNFNGTYHEAILLAMVATGQDAKL